MERKERSVLEAVVCFKACFVSVIFILGCNSSISKDINTETTAEESEYLSKLSREVKVKQIFNYLLETNFQKKFDYIYKLYGENGTISFDEAFSILPQIEDDYIYKKIRLGEAFSILSQNKDDYIYKKIRLIESYRYYGIPIEIYEFPKGNQGNYYLAIADMLINGSSYEILLFDKRGKYLDKYSISSRYPNGRKVYEFKEIQENIYGILMAINGNHGHYISIVMIKNKKIDEVHLVSILPDVPGEDENVPLEAFGWKSLY